MGLFKEEKTAEEIELEKQELEKKFNNFKGKYNLPNLEFEDFLLLQDKFTESKNTAPTWKIQNTTDPSNTMANITACFQNFYILEQLGRSQQQLEALNQKFDELNNKFDTLIELLSKDKV